MRFGLRTIVFLVFSSLMMLSGQATAHPHAWMDMQSRFMINDQHQLFALDLVWHFDDFYSANIIEDMKAKKEPMAQQYQEFAKQSIEYMAKENWLTHLTVDGKKIMFTMPKLYRTEKQQYHLKLHFLLPLKDPIPVAGKTFHLQIYDSTYYVEMLHHDVRAISVSDNAKDLCTYQLNQPHPPSDLSAYAASLDATQQTDDGLGKQFADEVVLTCKP